MRKQPLSRKKTWKEVSGRTDGDSAYKFGDLTRTTIRRGTTSKKSLRHRDEVKNLLYQYRSHTSDMSEQELYETVRRFLPTVKDKDVLKGIRMFKEHQVLQVRFLCDLERLTDLS